MWQNAKKYCAVYKIGTVDDCFFQKWFVKFRSLKYQLRLKLFRNSQHYITQNVVNKLKISKFYIENLLYLFGYVNPFDALCVCENYCLNIIKIFHFGRNNEQWNVDRWQEFVGQTKWKTTMVGFQLKNVIVSLW